MTVITNNVQVGAVDGSAQGSCGSGFIPAGLNIGIGDPSDKITAQTGSDIFFDTVNGQYYMALGAAGSTWIKLGSTA